MSDVHELKLPLQGNGAMFFTSATLPLFADIAIAPLNSGVGRLTEPPPCAASWIRRYCPGWIDLPEPKAVAFADEKAPAAEVYWTDQPVKSTATVPLLWISMKSFLKVEPALPPPPYT
jgi:hypothetical protein